MSNRFKCRRDYNCCNVLHDFQSFPLLQQWLEALTKKDHQLLVYLHAAYLNCVPEPALSFGNTKSAFWNMISAYGSFRYGMLVVNRRIPLSAVTVVFFVVRTIHDWFDFLDSHNFDTADCWNVKLLLCIHCSPQFIPNFMHV